jgi:mono/diheme cytochrome c family protein
MKKVLKWIGIVVGVLLGIIVVAAVALNLIGNSHWNKKWAIEPAPLTVPTDAASLARGKHIVNVLCTGCHGPDLTGSVVFEQPGIASVYAANITGLADTWSDDDFVLAIHHGVDEEGRQLAVMPSEAFSYFSAEDLGSIIAYLKTIPRSGEEQAEPSATFMGKVLYGAGMFGSIFAAEHIDHDRPYTPMPAEIGANAEYGGYLASLCHECHGPDLRGGEPPFPGMPPAPSLAVVRGWTEDGFFQTLETGTDPGGHVINPEFMPFDEIRKFDREELQGLYLYLHNLP